MSRIGTKPIKIPAGVTTKLDGDDFLVSSDNKKLSVKIHPKVEVSVEGDSIQVKRRGNDRLARSLHGLTRTLVSNAVVGVSEGYQKDLEVVGVGYRSLLEGNKLTLKLGYSHDVEFVAPEGIEFETKKNIISVKGSDKQLVGQIAAEIRSARKPEPYKGKGIKYSGERIIRKVGKALKSTTPGA
jgi:large subunit ribosomal protein L6